MDEDVLKTSRAVLGDVADLMLLRRKIEIAEGRILLEPPNRNLTNGEYHIGDVLYNGVPSESFGLREKEFLKHILIAGNTGTGKTNTLFVILKSLIENGKPFLILDWKRNYRELVAREEFKDTLVYTVGRDVSEFSFNPLIPPMGISPDVWLTKLVEILSHSYFLAEGALSILQKSIDNVYQKFGIYSGNPESFPTFKDVIEELFCVKAHAGSRRYQWLESSIRTLEGLCFRNTGKVFNCQQNAMDDLLKKNVILELDSLNHANKIFFIETLLLWIYYYRLNQSRREDFLHAIIIEEAHRLFKKSSEYRIEEPVLNIMLREIRELCESIILIAQNPSLIPITILSNTYLTISHNLKHELDVKTIGQCSLLSHDEYRYLGILKTGECIVKMQDRYSKPFHCRIPLFSIQKGNITDDDLRLRILPDSPDSRQNLPLLMKIEQLQEIPENNIRKDERELLLNVRKKPFMAVSGRYKAIHVSTGRGNLIRIRLKQAGLLNQARIRTGKSTFTNLLYLTNKGMHFLGELGYEHSFTTDGESLEHQYWKHKIKDKLEGLGWTAWLEWNNIDVYAERAGRMIVFEVKTKPDGWKENLVNVQKHAPNAEIFFVSSNKDTLKALKNVLPSCFKVCCPWQFLVEK